MTRAGPGRQLLVFLTLLALAALSYGLSFVALGPVQVPVALAISAAKAVLVAAFFMELVDQRASNRFALVVATVLVLTLVGLMAMDTLTHAPPTLLPP